MVCELAVCEDGYDQSFDPAWDLMCMQTLSDVAHWSSHGGLGGSGRRDHGRSRPSSMSMSNGNQRRYTTTTTPESLRTKICTRRDEVMNCEPCRTMASTLSYPSERPLAANTSVDFPLLT